MRPWTIANSTSEEPAKVLLIRTQKHADPG